MAFEKGGQKPRRAVIDPVGRRVAFNMKTTQALRNRVEAAASVSGRTLSHEVECLVERGLMAEDLMKIVRETVRQEMRAEFEARREVAADPVGDAIRTLQDFTLKNGSRSVYEIVSDMDDLCGPAAYQRINGGSA